MTVFGAIVFVVAVFAGGTAAIAGFGIGSLLTPLLALDVGMSVAVAAVSIPHITATGLRLYRLRSAVDRRVLVRFGVLSALGGLAGALLYTKASGRTLTIALGVLLILTGFSALLGWAQRWHPRRGAWMLGLLSGFFGGLAGNQGGVRAGAMMHFGLAPAAFVATSTAVAMLVDLARMPVYLASSAAWLSEWRLIAIATAGVIVGTLLGERILMRLSPERFRQVVGWLILALGVLLLIRAR